MNQVLLPEDTLIQNIAEFTKRQLIPRLRFVQFQTVGFAKKRGEPVLHMKQGTYRGITIQTISQRMSDSCEQILGDMSEHSGLEKRDK